MARSRLTSIPPNALAGRTALVTGATAGIGRAAAEGLAKLGAELVLVVRDRARGERVAAEIADATGGKRADLLVGDLASLADVRAVASAFVASGRPLHLLLLNAGVMMIRREETRDGFETTFAVNHLAPFLLANLLLARLRESAPARVVVVASDAYGFSGGRLDFGDLQSERSFASMRVYGKSKLANILFTQELARRLAGSGVTANCLHPGFVRSQLGKQNSPLLHSLLMLLLSPFARSPEQGAETAIYLGASPELTSTTGKYFVDCRETALKPHGSNPDDARRLWIESERMTGLAPASAAG